MLWNLFEIGVNVYQAFLMVYFLRHKLTPVAKLGYRDILCLLGVTAFFSSYLFVDLSLVDTWVFLIPFLYSLKSFSDKWYAKLFWVTVLAILMISVVNLTISIFSSAIDASWADIMARDSVMRIAFVLASNIALTVSIFLISKIKRAQSPLSRIAMVLIFSQNVAHMFILEFLFSLRYFSAIHDVWFFVACFGIFISSYFSYAIYEILSKNADRELQYKQQLQTLEMNAQHQEELKSLCSQMLTRQHDLKHLLQSLDQMQQNHASAESIALMDEIKREALVCDFSTGNVTVDALLTAKQNIMREKRIVFRHTLHPLSHYPLSSTQLCVVLGNLLDNAVEGIERIPREKRGEPHIILTLEHAWNMFYIRCENPVEPATLKVQGTHYVSSKPFAPSAAHGYGLPSIQGIVSAAEGTCKISVEDSKFTVLISIPGQENADE